MLALYQASVPMQRLREDEAESNEVSQIQGTRTHAERSKGDGEIAIARFLAGADPALRWR